MGEITPKQRAAMAEVLKGTEEAIEAMRSVSFGDVPSGIFGGSPGGQSLAASLQRASEHLRQWTAEKIDELEGTLDEMFAEAARRQAADREATAGEER